MTLSQSIFTIGVLIVASAFFSMAEISLAAARRLRLRQMADEGDARADRVLRMQEQPGDYFTVVQIGQNAVAILGGIVGEGALGPHFHALLSLWFSEPVAQTGAVLVSFLIIASLFILLADLFPKRLGMAEPERLVLRLARPMACCMALLRPLTWFYSRGADALFRVFGLSSLRDESITSDDILAMMDAGARAGVLAVREQQVITNVFELDTRTVSSAMSPRDSVAFFLRDDPDAVIRLRIAAEPFSTYPVCEGDIDHVVGYVDAKDLFQRVLNDQPISLADDSLVRKVLIVPDRLTLSEVLEQFRQVHEDFAVIVNEYSLVVGVVTLNDVMSTVMGDLIAPMDEEQIVQRDENSWLIDGVTPIQDVLRTLSLDELPHAGEYETLAGFLMVMLRRVPRRTDSVHWGGYTFEVMDVDSHRIDQVMVSRAQAASSGGNLAPLPSVERAAVAAP
ncbi:polyamine export protein PaeA [Verminephrobacter aporrectodeae]|uniref:hemolysin family protein n=1 Tax=Verminephrobacter aporrectodeae TaxID=1110389 RepID=UPI0022374900|nr:hemolysin family protein [Verminephrobacter aporrectodeae]MCW5256659.1 HlyC/CorC family transporter [Verminephrobacter aporrectodeae subsp. tuberculatae]MCW8164498.1 HlyC/CorC family transporter [Verminephrobacter aporrectodeae subsp. tuberculatae]MCW8168774.1 HlyC/CorC family transporter [Verminephrobacter aporrectodeae subsp. tuberculatae]MCW8176637.1 HlyC/CorC family transporter [Verminephrobacter aporrectodeae subsp. tuberculatae]MCW8204050.1 HlyC/CorC family transporter [Verminephrobac